MWRKWLGCLFFLSSCAIVFAANQPIRVNNNLSIASKHQHEDDVLYNINVYYPELTGTQNNASQKFNQLMTTYIRETIEQFKSHAAALPAPTINGVPATTSGNTLTISYEAAVIYLHLHHIVTVHYTIDTFYAGTGFPTLKHTTFNYDLEESSLLSLKKPLPEKKLKVTL